MTCTKRSHKTQAEAQVALEDTIAHFKRTGQSGKSWRRLTVYQCKKCGYWHLGKVSIATPLKVSVKDPTPGQLRRAAAKAAEKAAKQKLFQDYHDTLVYCQRLTDNEIARMISLGAKPRAVQQSFPIDSLATEG